MVRSIGGRHLMGTEPQRLSIQSRTDLASLDNWLSAIKPATLSLFDLCAGVTSYLVAGHRIYAGASFPRRRARVSYPGRPSINGQACDEMEGFSRLAPLLGAWVRGQGRMLQLPNGESVDVLSLLAIGLEDGTDPESPGFWGEIDGPNQKLCEAADIALAVWLAGPALEGVVSAKSWARLLEWLRGANRSDVKNNNWHLFPLVVDAVLRAVYGSGFGEDSRRFHERSLSEMYAGDGWFLDGPEQRFDYYNSWGFHYLLYWLHVIRGSSSWMNYPEIGRPFVDTMPYLFSERGFPLMGRSVCYRMAAPTGLLTAAMVQNDTRSIGLAKRAVLLTWRLFIERGALDRGRITPGAYKADERLLDAYSGPASSFWSLRSLIPLIANSPDTDLWKTSALPLPVEEDDYRLEFKVPGWIVEGSKSTGHVSLYIPANQGKRLSVLRRPVRSCLKNTLLALAGRSFLVPLEELAYEQYRYSSDSDFWKWATLRNVHTKPPRLT